MVRAMLTGAVKEAIKDISAEGESPGHSMVVVITTDDKSNRLMARFVGRELLTILKTKILQKTILPAAEEKLEIHLFGIDDFPKEAVIELNIFPAYRFCGASEDYDDINLKYFLTVRVENPGESHYRESDNPRAPRDCLKSVQGEMITRKKC